MPNPCADLSEVEALYDKSLYLQAHERAKALALYDRRDSPEALILAGRLAGNLGAQRLGRICFLRAHRLAPKDPRARYFRARMVLEGRGPWPAWQFVQAIGDMPDADPEIRSEWYALTGLIAGTFRDFEMAEYWFDRAEKTLPENPWVWIERAWLLEQADRYDEALATARKSLESRPWYRAGVQSTAHALTLVGRDEEALELMTEALRHIESFALAGQLFLLQTELGLWKEAWETLSLCDSLTPLCEKEVGHWMSGARARVAYELGNPEVAIRFARESESGYFKAVVENMERAPANAPRVSLPVGFVRQYHMTCAPATLSSLSRFWQKPAEHLEIAEAICYDGTPWHSERGWAERNGWVTREFTITWDSARALLDRGIPFTLTTSAPGSAHLQAVVGYDARRGILEIRDPYHRLRGEALAERLIEHHRSTGPRGMALVPRENAHLLDGLDLPDAALYDSLSAVQGALEDHRREEACSALEAVEASATADHPLVLQARRAIAAYDGDTSGILDVTERLLAHFPTDANLRLSRLSCLRELGKRAERVEYLESISAQVGGKLDDQEEQSSFALLEAAPVFWQQLAQELRADARQHDRAIALLERALRRQPTDAGSLYTLASILWDRGKKGTALTLFRFCACVEDKVEHLASTYFALSRLRNRTDQALNLLKRRFEQFGAISGHPARTLFGAFEELGRGPEAFAVLERALSMRPDDGELQLFAVDAYARSGREKEAEALLARAEKHTSRPDWLRAAAQTQTERGDGMKALSLWREVLALEPLSIDAHRSAARLIAQTESHAAVNAHFVGYSSRFPHHAGLHQLWAESLREAGDLEAQEHVLARLVDINPADLWTRRELARSFAERRLLDRAVEELQVAEKLDPSDTHTWSLRGLIMSLANRAQDARSAFRQSIRLSADNEFSITRLVGDCETLAERREMLEFVQSELVRQSIAGNGLIAFRLAAQNVLPPDEVLGHLKQALMARPDLWTAWSVSIDQLTDMGRADEARKVGEQAVDRFPLVPTLWMSLASALRACHDSEGERAALLKAIQMSPGFTPARRALAEALEREGKLAEALSCLEGACSREPLEPANQAALASCLWKSGRRGEAIDLVKKVAREDPNADWAWEWLHDWCAESGRGAEVEAEVRDRASRKSNDPRSWLLLAKYLNEPRHLEERLQALARASVLDPHLLDAVDLRVELLSGAGRFDEALAACRVSGAAPDGTPLPPRLEGRAAWVEAERGNLPEAIRRMRTVLDRESDYLWGWSQISRWYRDTGDFMLYEFAARKIVGIAPQAPVGHGLLADAKMRQGDRAAAKTALRRAMDLAPEYSFAGAALFDLQMEDNDFAGAQETAERMLLTRMDGWAHRAAIAVAVRRRDLYLGMQRLRELCVLPGDAEEALQAVDSLLQEPEWRQAADQVYWELLNHPACQPEVGALWMDACVRRQDWTCEATVEQLLARGEIGARAAGAFVSGLAETGRVDQLRKYIHLHRDILRAYNRSWTSTAFAFSALGESDRVREWCSDWDRRVGLRPWMLVYLVTALRLDGLDAEAARVSAHALQLEEDNTVSLHALWLGTDAALTGNIPEARRYLRQAEGMELQPICQFLYALVASVVETGEAAPEARSAAFSAAKKRLAAAREVWDPGPYRKLAVGLYSRAVGKVAEQIGSVLAGIWATQEKLRYR